MPQANHGICKTSCFTDVLDRTYFDNVALKDIRKVEKYFHLSYIIVATQIKHLGQKYIP